tara:strand:+ start:2172 stop:3251 length:1080 start_codon:yes stop_codon:yes gene_type:complete
MKIVTVIGARPQFIKAASFSRVLLSEKVDEIIVHTGQHFDDNMSKVFFDEMGIPKPKYNLNINNLSHGAMTGRMMEEIENILLIEKPDLVVVYGDTNSTLAGALAAKKLHIKIAHIEAGLRSFNNKMPEEINRILTDRISDYLFCPTQSAIDNLNNEGFNNIDCHIVKTGDISLDSALYYSINGAKDKQFSESELPKNYIFSTLHRPENTDKKECLFGIVNALNYIHKNIQPVVLAIHPRTKTKLIEYDLELKVKTIDPVGYIEVIRLIKNSNLVLTDSGGLQKEAYFFKKPCVTLREQTEWVELIENKVNVLVGSNEIKIKLGVEHMLERDCDFSKEIFGKGKTANEIIKFLKSQKDD